MRKLLGFLTVSLAAVAAFGAFDAKTIAFYPFTEGEDGESALGDGLLKNAVDPALYAGTATTADASASGLRFSSDVPGPCVVDRSRVVATGVRSVQAYGTKSATLALPGLASALSGHSEWTLEYFFKMNSDEYVDWSYMLKLNAGLTWNSSGGTLGLVPTQLGASLRVWFHPDSGLDDYPTGYLPISGLKDSWNHLALTYADGNLKLYVQYKKVATVALADAGSVAEQAVNLMNGIWKGRVCAVRASSCVREEKDMLRAISQEVPAKRNLGADTLAFYPFDEGASGASLAGKTVFNAAEPTLHIGTVTVTEGELLFDDDAPAKYVFTNAVAGASPWVTDPQSVYFKKNSAKGATIDFGSLMSALAQNGEGTLEFFWKMVPEDAFEADWKVSVDMGQVFQDSGATSHQFGLYIPVAKRTTPATIYQAQLRMGADNAASTGFNRDYGNLEDGLWHHLAVVCSSEGVRLYCDYKAANAIGAATSTAYTLQSVSSAIDLVLGNGAFGGKISCVRVSKRQLSTPELLHASDLPAYDSGEVFVWHFDEKKDGETFTSVSNGAFNVIRAMPGLYVSSEQSDLLADATVSTLVGTAYPQASRRRRNIRNGEQGDVVSSAGSAIRMDVDPGNEEIFSLGMDVSAPAAQNVAGSFTAETFFRYDRTTWVRDVFPKLYRQRMTVFGQAASDLDYSWELILNNAAQANPSLNVNVNYADRTAEAFSGTQTAVLADGKWHHVAMTYDAMTGSVQVYLDHQPYLSANLTKALFGFEDMTKVKLRTFHLGGRQLNNQPFCGWFDACRLRRGVWPVSSFYREEGLGLGMMLLFR